MKLLTVQEHQIVLLNVKVNLLWKNVDGTFVGPFISEEDYKKFVCDRVSRGTDAK